jgi:glycosyltransferase involved in cell wall biosynthesis
MRIAQVIASLDPDMGGLPKSAVSMSAALAAAGEEVALFFYADTEALANIEAVYGALPGYERVQKIVLQPGRWPRLRDPQLTRALEAFSPSLIHTHGLWEPLLMQAQRFGLRRQIPYVFCAHSMMDPWQCRNHRLAKWVLQYLFGWKRVWKKAAFVQVLNASEAGHWQARGIGQTRLIANGIFLQEDSGAGAVEWPVPFVLSLARLHAQKSPDLLLEAFAKLAAEDADVHLVLAGPDYGLQAPLQARAKDLGLADRVHFPGTLTGGRKWAALHGCACFCLPSQAEGFSMAVLEAALAGVPLVLSEACYFPELVALGGAVISPLRIDDLAAVLAKVMRQPGEMGTRARELVVEAYQWSVIAGLLQHAYVEAGA